MYLSICTLHAVEHYYHLCQANQERCQGAKQNITSLEPADENIIATIKMRNNTASSNGESAPKHQNKQHIKSQIITYFCADLTHILIVPILAL